MELLFKDVVLGKVDVVDHDFPWVYGSFLEYSAYEIYRDFFEALAGGEDFEESKFDNEWFEEAYWTLKEGAKIIKISGPPVIFSEKRQIAFRYR